MKPHFDLTWIDYFKRWLFVSTFLFALFIPCVIFLHAFGGNWLFAGVFALVTALAATISAWWMNKKASKL